MKSPIYFNEFEGEIAEISFSCATRTIPLATLWPPATPITINVKESFLPAGATI